VGKVVDNVDILEEEGTVFRMNGLIDSKHHKGFRNAAWPGVEILSTKRRVRWDVTIKISYLNAPKDNRSVGLKSEEQVGGITYQILHFIQLLIQILRMFGAGLAEFVDIDGIP
jgi:hypothetical protein